jgi:hypothetical protein
MVLLDEENGRWYCYADDEVFLARENRWVGDGTYSRSVTPVRVSRKARSPESAILWGMIWILFSIFAGATGFTLMAIMSFFVGIVGLVSGIVAIQKANGKKAPIINVAQTTSTEHVSPPPIDANPPWWKSGQAPTTGQMKLCVNCQGEIPQEAKFCDFCGKPQEPPQQKTALKDQQGSEVITPAPSLTTTPQPKASSDRIRSPDAWRWETPEVKGDKKQCPRCGNLNSSTAWKCNNCRHEFFS